MEPLWFCVIDPADTLELDWPDAAPEASAIATDRANTAPISRRPRHIGRRPCPVKSYVHAAISHPPNDAGAVDMRAQLRVASIAHGPGTGQMNVQRVACQHFDIAGAL